ncbi:S1 family peptidase [Neisseria cinerea]|uniref:S1 family peptidase n=1 Tax=Neisseria cinerea TaxID=483 RepID=UPI0028899320|nr:serine protease [Neisseria cinerea]
MEIANALIHNTVRIECFSADDQSISTGTAFLFLFDFNKTEVTPVLVTNKHVVFVESAKKIAITLTKDENGSPNHEENITLIIEDFIQICLPHPDENIDLCIAPVGHFFNQLINHNFLPFIKGLRESDIMQTEEMDQLSAFEEVFMIGYPNGLWDSKNNLPIFRRGITTTHPAIDFEGKKEFMIDVACFPGSSGSPVFKYIPAGLRKIENDGFAITADETVKLMGILYAGPQQTISGEIYITTVNKPISVSSIPINLGFVIKAEKLLDFKPILKKFLEKNRE